MHGPARAVTDAQRRIRPWKAHHDFSFSSQSAASNRLKILELLNDTALNNSPAVVRSGLSNRGARFDGSSRGRIASCSFSLLGFGVFSDARADVTVVASEFEDLQYAAFGGNPNGSQAVLRIGGNTVKGREWYAVLKPAAVEVLEQVHAETLYHTPHTLHRNNLCICPKFQGRKNPR